MATQQIYTIQMQQNYVIYFPVITFFSVMLIAKVSKLFSTVDKDLLKRLTALIFVQYLLKFVVENELQLCR